MRMDISASLFQIVMGLAVYLVIAVVLIAVSVIDFERAASRMNTCLSFWPCVSLLLPSMLCGEAPPRRLRHLPLQASFR